MDDEGQPAPAKPAAAPPKKGDALGLAVSGVPAATRAELRVPNDRLGDVMQEVLGADPGTDALDEGDLVVELNRQPTPDLKAYRRVLGSLAPGDAAWLYVYRPKERTSFLTRVEVEKRREGPGPDRRRRGRGPLVAQDDLRVRGVRGARGRERPGGPEGGRAGVPRPRLPRHQDAADGRPRGPEAAQGARRRAPGGRPLGPRHGQGRGGGGEARRLRLHREAPGERAHPHRRAQRPRAEAARRREPPPAPRVRRPLPHGRPQPRHGEGVGGRAPGRAHERHRAHHRGERDGQGARGARDPPQLEPRETRRSCR